MAQRQPDRADDWRPDDELVGRTLSGDGEAFGVLWDRHHRSVFGYGFRKLGDRARAEDVAAETFGKALAKLETYRGGGFRAWLFAIAHNAIVDELRAATPIVSLDAVAERAVVRDMGDDGRSGIEHYALLEALPRLAAGEREVIELRLAGLWPDEIARVIGKTRPAVDMAYSRGLQRLRTLFGTDDAPTGGLRHG